MLTRLSPDIFDIQYNIPSASGSKEAVIWLGFLPYISTHARTR